MFYMILTLLIFCLAVMASLVIHFIPASTPEKKTRHKKWQATLIGLGLAPFIGFIIGLYAIALPLSWLLSQFIEKQIVNDYLGYGLIPILFLSTLVTVIFIYKKIWKKS